MRGVTTVATIVLAASSATAFAPVKPSYTPLNTLFAEAPAEVADEKFDEVNLVRVLGLNRMKRIIRKSKRSNNQKKED